MLVTFLSPALIRAQSLIVSDSFENDTFTGNWRRAEKCCDYSITRSDSVAVSGRSSIRFELNQTDKSVANGKRAELVWKTEKTSDVERWYRFSIFLPDSYVKEVISDILAQWHETPDTKLGETYRTAPIALKTQNGHWRAAIQWATDPVNTDESISGKELFDLGKYETNQWTNWVFHIKFSYKEDGMVEVFKNDELVLHYHGPNYYNDQIGPFFKFGIYKPDWKNANSKSIVTKRIVFFDDVIVGDQKIDFKSIKSAKIYK